jgi:membrane protein implicated in regulation of membrane protease activity
MSWYWWVLVGIVAVNGLVIALIALALATIWWRKRRAAGAEQRDQSEISQKAP